MADASTTPQTRYGKRTICLYFEQDQYHDVVADADIFRQHLNRLFQDHPEIFPPGFQDGYNMKDIRFSKKLELPIRRITLKNKEIYSVRPSFAMLSMKQRLRRLKGWAMQHLSGVVLEKTLDLCAKGKFWSIVVRPSRRSRNE